MGRNGWTLGREAYAAPPSFCPHLPGRLSVSHGGERKSTFSRECETVKMTPIASSYGELVLGQTLLPICLYCPVVLEACGREKP